MDIIITLVRLPVGLAGMSIVLMWWLFLFPFETALAILCLPFGVIFMKRSEFKSSWICSWPNSLSRIWPDIKAIFKWVFDD